MTTNSIDSNIIELILRATSGFDDGWNQERAKEQLIDIRDKSNSRQVKNYIGEALGLSTEN